MPDKVLDLRGQNQDKDLGAEGGLKEDTKTTPEKETLSLSWEAQEFPSQPKDRATWILITGIIAAVLVVIFLLTRNFLGVVLVPLGAFVWLLYAFRPARIYTYKITPLGIEIGKQTYSFESLSSFWIFYEPPALKEAVIRRKGLISQQLVLPLGSTEPVAVRRALILFLPEEHQKLSALEIFLRRIGF